MILIIIITTQAKVALQDVRLDDGTVALGYRPDTKGLRDDLSWKVAPIPASFARFHDTITAPPAALPIAKALGCGVHFLMVDFEDSSTVAYESLLAGLHACTLANRRQLVATSPKGKRYAVTDEGKPIATEMLLRFEGLHLPNAHFLVDGFPMPAHIVTIALYLYHNWQPLQVPKPPLSVSLSSFALTTTRHDTTRHDTTRHDTTRHDTTRHDTTRHAHNTANW